MKKFSSINERKVFITDPSVIKRYASFVIPLYITGELICDVKILDEYLEMNKAAQKEKSKNLISDLEVLAVKAVLGDNPLTPKGYDILRADIDKKCIKLERFLRVYLLKKKDFD